MTRAPILPAHIEDTVQAIADVHIQHAKRATAVQRAVDKMTSLFGRPRFVVVMSLLLIGWIAFNLMLKAAGRAPFDAPPFQWLQDLGTLLALYITVLILITQRRENLLIEQREQLTLELAMLSEKKTAKIIALLEELRRDHPQISNRTDAEADAMAQRTDPQAVLDAITQSHQEAEALD